MAVGKGASDGRRFAHFTNRNGKSGMRIRKFADTSATDFS
jgi:hypothetical protein